MTRRFLLSASLADPALADPTVAGTVLDQAEAAGLDLLLLGRAGAVPFDAQVLAAWAAPRLTRMGVVAVIPPRLGHPFHVARALSAVDYLAGGLLGWSPVAEGEDPEQIADLVQATRALWDGWDADTLVIDKASGYYLDTGKVRASHYEGRWYKTQGPVNAMRPLQDHPLLVVDAASPFTVPGVDVAIAAEGQTAPEAARLLRRVTLTDDPAALAQAFAQGEIDGLHIDLAGTTQELPRLAERFGALATPATTTGTLRQRLGLPLPDTLSAPIKESL